MLQNIREKFTGWVALLILGAIGLSFVFVGLNYSFIGSSYAAKVDGVDVGLAQFENSYREQLQQNPQIMNLPDDIRLQLRRNILEQLVQQRVIDNYLNEAGYRVNDDVVTSMIQQQPEFQKDGKFDIETYRSSLALVGYDPARFEEAQRTAIVRGQLQRAIRGSSVVTPSTYRQFLNLAFENRVVATAELSPDAVADAINVTPEMVSAYYEENPTMFELPESADIEYVEIDRDAVAAQVSVTEKQLLEYYEVNKSRYLQDEQRQARHILILFGDDESGAQDVANEMLTRVRSGESFAELAKQFSQDTTTASNGGDMGARTEEQLDDALGAAVFSMQVGQVDGPIKGDFGFHVVRLDSILESGPLPFEQIRAPLLTELQDEQAEGLYIAMERKLSDALFDAGEINELADAIDGVVKSSSDFTRNGGSPFGANQAVIDAVFDPSVLSGAQMSEVIEVDADTTIVVSVKEHRPAKLETLENVSVQINDMLRAQQADAEMESRATLMVEQLQSGVEFAAAAEAVGAVASEPVVVTRNANDVDQALAVAVFTADKPSQDKPVAGSTRNQQGGHTVYSLQAVISGRPEAIPVAERDAGKNQLVDQYGVGDFVAFTQALRANAEVIVNEDALAAQDLFQ